MPQDSFQTIRQNLAEYAALVDKFFNTYRPYNYFLSCYDQYKQNLKEVLTQNTELCKKIGLAKTSNSTLCMPPLAAIPNLDDLLKQLTSQDQDNETIVNYVATLKIFLADAEVCYARYCRDKVKLQIAVQELNKVLAARTPILLAQGSEAQIHAHERNLEALQNEFDQPYEMQCFVYDPKRFFEKYECSPGKGYSDVSLVRMAAHVQNTQLHNLTVTEPYINDSRKNSEIIAAIQFNLEQLSQLVTAEDATPSIKSQLSSLLTRAHNDEESTRNNRSIQVKPFATADEQLIYETYFSLLKTYHELFPEDTAVDPAVKLKNLAVAIATPAFATKNYHKLQNLSLDIHTATKITTQCVVREAFAAKLPELKELEQELFISATNTVNQDGQRDILDEARKDLSQEIQRWREKIATGEGLDLQNLDLAKTQLSLSVAAKNNRLIHLNKHLQKQTSQGVQPTLPITFDNIITSMHDETKKAVILLILKGKFKDFLNILKLFPALKNEVEQNKPLNKLIEKAKDVGLGNFETEVSLASLPLLYPELIAEYIPVIQKAYAAGVEFLKGKQISLQATHYETLIEKVVNPLVCDLATCYATHAQLIKERPVILRQFNKIATQVRQLKILLNNSTGELLSPITCQKPHLSSDDFAQFDSQCISLCSEIHYFLERNKTNFIAATLQQLSQILAILDPAEAYPEERQNIALLKAKYPENQDYLQDKCDFSSLSIHQIKHDFMNAKLYLANMEKAKENKALLCNVFINKTFALNKRITYLREAAACDETITITPLVESFVEFQRILFPLSLVKQDNAWNIELQIAVLRETKRADLEPVNEALIKLLAEMDAFVEKRETKKSIQKLAALNPTSFLLSNPVPATYEQLKNEIFSTLQQQIKLLVNRMQTVISYLAPAENVAKPSNDFIEKQFTPLKNIRMALGISTAQSDLLKSFDVTQINVDNIANKSLVDIRYILELSEKSIRQIESAITDRVTKEKQLQLQQNQLNSDLTLARTKARALGIDVKITSFDSSGEHVLTMIQEENLQRKITNQLRAELEPLCRRITEKQSRLDIAAAQLKLDIDTELLSAEPVAKLIKQIQQSEDITKTLQTTKDVLNIKLTTIQNKLDNLGVMPTPSFIPISTISSVEQVTQLMKATGKPELLATAPTTAHVTPKNSNVMPAAQIPQQPTPPIPPKKKILITDKPPENASIDSKNNNLNPCVPQVEIKKSAEPSTFFSRIVQKPKTENILTKKKVVLPKPVIETKSFHVNDADEQTKAIALSNITSPLIEEYKKVITRLEQLEKYACQENSELFKNMITLRTLHDSDPGLAWKQIADQNKSLEEKFALVYKNFLERESFFDKIKNLPLRIITAARVKFGLVNLDKPNNKFEVFYAFEKIRLEGLEQAYCSSRITSIVYHDIHFKKILEAKQAGKIANELLDHFNANIMLSVQRNNKSHTDTAPHTAFSTRITDEVFPEAKAVIRESPRHTFR